MATWYVRSDGSDANTGAGNTAATACATLNGVLAKAVAAGDQVWIAPGTYRQIVSMTTSGTSGSVLTISGDVTASHFDGTVTPGEVILSAYTTNDTTVPGTVAVELNGKSYLALEDLTIVGGGSGSGGCVKATVSHSRGITLRRCCLLWSAAAPAVQYTGIATTPADWTIDSCLLYGGNNTTTIALALSPADPAQAGDLDINFLVVNTRIIHAGGGIVIRLTGPGTATGGGKPGGLRLRNCTLLGATGVNASGTNISSTTYPVEVYNCYIHASTALSASVSGQIVNDYCNLVGTVSNVTVGTNTKQSTTGLVAPLVHVGQEGIAGRTFAARPFLTPLAGSPLLGYGNGGTSPGPPTVDVLNRPRPAGGASTSPAIGYVERHDTGAPGGSANADGGSGDCLKLTGPADHDLFVAVDAVSTTVSVKVKWDANHGDTNKPQAVLSASSEIGYAGETKTAAGTAGSAYETLTFTAFTPSKKGVVTLRLVSRAAAGNGIAYFDTIGIA